MTEPLEAGRATQAASRSAIGSRRPICWRACARCAASGSRSSPPAASTATRRAALDARFAAAFSGVLARWPAVFGGTDLDPDANRKRMEALVRRMEDLATSLSGPAATGDAALSPTTRLAAMLKEALAANTIGGKVDDDSRLRAAHEDVRQAQASWSRIGPVPEEARRALADRFQRAIRRISDASATVERPGSDGWRGTIRRLEWIGSPGRRRRIGPARRTLADAADVTGLAATRGLSPYWILSSSTSNTSMPYGALLPL